MLIACFIHNFWKFHPKDYTLFLPQKWGGLGIGFKYFGRVKIPSCHMKAILYREFGNKDESLLANIALTQMSSAKLSERGVQMTEVTTLNDYRQIILDAAEIGPAIYIGGKPLEGIESLDSLTERLNLRGHPIGRVKQLEKLGWLTALDAARRIIDSSKWQNYWSNPAITMNRNFKPMKQRLKGLVETMKDLPEIHGAIPKVPSEELFSDFVKISGPQGVRIQWEPTEGDEYIPQQPDDGWAFMVPIGDLACAGPRAFIDISLKQIVS
jgi:hypothetical protein